MDRQYSYAPPKWKFPLDLCDTTLAHITGVSLQRGKFGLVHSGTTGMDLGPEGETSLYLLEKALQTGLRTTQPSIFYHMESSLYDIHPPDAQSPLRRMAELKYNSDRLHPPMKWFKLTPRILVAVFTKGESSLGFFRGQDLKEIHVIRVEDEIHFILRMAEIWGFGWELECFGNPAKDGSSGEILYIRTTKGEILGTHPHFSKGVPEAIL